MIIKRVIVGLLKENCYILCKNNKYLVIDPGSEYEKIKKEIKGELLGILITHYHFDHVGALKYFLNDYKVKLYDINNFEENVSIDNFSFKMIKTPGHKEDLVSFLFEDKLFCGDFIFENSIGRYDLPGGNIFEMKKSIKYLLDNFENLTIYPGHGKKTSLEKEKENLKNNIN